jgi:P-type Cu+ transporter
MRRMFAVALFLGLGGPANAAIVSRTFVVQGWDCGGCVRKTEAVVQKLAGVQRATGDLPTHRLTVFYEDTLVTPAEIVAAIGQAGYTCPAP